MGADDRDRSADRRARDAWVRDALGEEAGDAAERENADDAAVVVEMEPVGGEDAEGEAEDATSDRAGPGQPEAVHAAPTLGAADATGSTTARTGLAAVLGLGIAGAAVAVGLMVLLIQQGPEATAGPVLVGLGVLVGLFVLQTAAGVVRRTGPG